MPAVAQMAPAYAAGGGEAESLLGPYNVLDNHAEKKSRCALSCTSRTALSPWRWTSISHLERRGRCWEAPYHRRGGVVETQCAPLLDFLHAAAVEGLVIPFEVSDLEVVAPDKALEAQRMEILQRDLPARFDAGSLGGASAGRY